MENETISELEARKELLVDSTNEARSEHQNPAFFIILMAVSFFVSFIFLILSIVFESIIFLILFISFLILGLIFMVAMISVVKNNKPINSTITKNRREIAEINKQIEDGLRQNVVINQTQFSVADEIAKFKKLLDDGVITQEEFDQKKKQLLNM